VDALPCSDWLQIATDVADSHSSLAGLLMVLDCPRCATAFVGCESFSKCNWLLYCARVSNELMGRLEPIDGLLQCIFLLLLSLFSSQQPARLSETICSSFNCFIRYYRGLGCAILRVRDSWAGNPWDSTPFGSNLWQTPFSDANTRTLGIADPKA